MDFISIPFSEICIHEIKNFSKLVINQGKSIKKFLCVKWKKIVGLTPGK